MQLQLDGRVSSHSASVRAQKAFSTILYVLVIASPLPACDLNQLNLNVVIALVQLCGLQQCVLQGVEVQVLPVAFVVVP